jgi:archaellum biogenesis ATPase FlaH
LDAFSNLVLAKCISPAALTKPTAFANVNEILNGGFPKGRLIEIYGRSQIGKSSLVLSLYPDETVIYMDLARKLCLDYKTDKVFMTPSVNDSVAFELLHEVIKENVIIIIDDLTMLGTIRNDSERFQWLMRKFMELQRSLVATESIILVLNQIRMSPSTGRSYNPHEGCLDAAIKIKMHYAEHVGEDELVYLDVEKHFWGKEGARCTLLVSKNKVSVPSFYRPGQFTQTQESEL